MTHGDDDGLRLPPAIAPRQIVVVPMLRDKPEDTEVLTYCEELVAALTQAQRLRPAPARAAGHQEDQVGGKALELGPARRAHHHARSVRATRRRAISPICAATRCATATRSSPSPPGKQDFIEEKAVQLLAEIQHGLYAEAKARLDDNIKSGVTDWAGVESYFCGQRRGVQRLAESVMVQAIGAELDKVDTKLKALKLTIRNAPLQQPDILRPACSRAQPAWKKSLIGRAY